MNKKDFSKQTLTIYSDGGSRGNPGNAGVGYLIYDQDKNLVFSQGKYIGLTTNNVAEYQAIKAALQYLLENNIVCQTVACYLDSELVVKQLMGIYKIKKPHLFQIVQEIKAIIQELKQNGLEKIFFNHVPREQNKEADTLVNLAVDEFLGKV